MHARGGLETEYMSDEWFAAVRACVDEAKKLGALRLRFDPDFERSSVSKDFKIRWFATKVHTSGDFEPVRVPNTIVKEFVVYADGKAIFAALPESEMVVDGKTVRFEQGISERE